MQLDELRRRLEALGCNWDERRFPVGPGRHRSGVLVTRKVPRTTRRHPPFFVDDVAIPVPKSFIEALCRSLDLDPDALLAPPADPN